MRQLREWLGELRPERGSMSVELVILMPVLLLALFTIIQVGLWVNAREVALHAAAEGSAAASAENATDEVGYAAATAFVAQVGSLSGTTVTVDRSATQVTVTVSGQAPSVVPGLTLPLVTQSSTSAIEAWSTP